MTVKKYSLVTSGLTIYNSLPSNNSGNCNNVTCNPGLTNNITVAFNITNTSQTQSFRRDELKIFAQFTDSSADTNIPVKSSGLY